MQILIIIHTEKPHYKPKVVIVRFSMYARGESNPNRRNRNPIFYPLNYGRIFPICVGKSTK